jgi:hypothetical protein
MLINALPLVNRASATVFLLDEFWRPTLVRVYI